MAPLPAESLHAMPRGDQLARQWRLLFDLTLIGRARELLPHFVVTLREVDRIGRGLAPFWPYLVFGQWTHVGSGTTFGLGAYGLEPCDARDGRGA